MKVNGNKAKLITISIFLIVYFYTNNSFCQERYINNNTYTLNKIINTSSNDSLKLILDNLYIKDQTFRQAYRCFKDKYSDDSDEMKFYWESIQKQDSINLITIVNIIDNYGWLGISKVGEQANKTIFLIVQHGDIEIQEKYLPLLKESVNKGESKGEFYALLVDRILVKKGLEQEYGTQIKVEKETGNYILYPIRDQNNVDVRRAKLGMKPINDYLKNYGLELKFVN